MTKNCDNCGHAVRPMDTYGDVHFQRVMWGDCLDCPDCDQSRCVCCGSSFAVDPGDQAEVVNRSTGARGVAHAECYLNETDIYEMA